MAGWGHAIVVGTTVSARGAGAKDALVSWTLKPISVHQSNPRGADADLAGLVDALPDSDGRGSVVLALSVRGQ